MIPDFITIENKGENEILANHPLLYWQSTVALTTGEEATDKYGRIFRFAKHRCLTFYQILTPKGIVFRLTGSIHKYAHNDSNATDLDYKGFVEAVNKLCDTFQTDFRKWQLKPFEFGLNLLLPFPVDIVLSALLNYKKQEYSFENEGKLYRFALSEYELKIYDKGAKEGIERYLLRIEVRLNKLNFLKQKGLTLKTLADLLKQATIERLGSILLNVWKDVIINEFVNVETRLSKKDKSFIKEHQNPKTWALLDGDKRQDARKRINEMVKRGIGKGLQGIISNLIENKNEELLNEHSQFVTIENTIETSQFITRKVNS